MTKQHMEQSEQEHIRGNNRAGLCYLSCAVLASAYRCVCVSVCVFILKYLFSFKANI